MAISVVMPALELTQESGKLVAWRKKEGETIAKGEVLLEIETDKAVMEIEAPGDGILAGIRVQEGAIVPVGQTIAWLVRPGETPPAEIAQSGSPERAAVAPEPKTSPVATTPGPLSAAGTRVSPKARRLAREHAVDITRLRGSGPDGAIVVSDVLAVAGSGSAAVLAGLETLSSTGRLMAERTTQSWTSVPHFFVVREVDAGALVQAREQLGAAVEKASGVRPTHTDFLIALVARALARHPRLNASWTSEGIRLHQEVNIGVAMAVKEGVVAPVVHRANAASLGEIAVQRRDLAGRAKAGRLRPSDIAGATFTISNLGMYSVDAFSAIITAPQAAILAVGRIVDRVVAVNDRPAIRPMMTVTLSCDHRVLDGARAAAFLNDLAEAINEPEPWLR